MTFQFLDGKTVGFDVGLVRFQCLLLFEGATLINRHIYI